MFDQLAPALSKPEILITDVQQAEAYWHDAGDFRARPAAILMAESADDVLTAVSFCAQHNIAITPRGAGTGLSGGCVPSNKALVISTERINHLNIDAERRIAVCGPGLITKRLQDEAAHFGLTYPPDPASFEESSLGGNVAENAGGLRCKRFGVTKDYVLGLTGVTADGRLLRAGCFANNRGFGLTDLLIASEGTLAIITEIALRLTPLPGRGTTLLIAFNTSREAAQTVTDITTAGMIPSVMEFLDGDAAACSNQYEQQDGLDDVAGILLIETDDRYAAEQTSAIEVIARKNNCSYLRSEQDSDKADELWRIRRNLSKAVKEMGEIHISEDVAVPNSRLPALVEFVAQMNESSPIRMNSFGHAGDGNLHVYFLAEKDTPETRVQVEKEIKTLMAKTIELGGTLSGEHGIGLAKKQFLALEYDPATLGVMKQVKTLFDPESILNPDKLFS